MADDHLRADRHALVEVRDIRIDETEATRRHRTANRMRLVGAVNAIDRAPEVKRACAHGIARSARHESRQ